MICQKKSVRDAKMLDELEQGLPRVIKDRSR